MGDRSSRSARAPTWGQRIEALLLVPSAGLALYAFFFLPFWAVVLKDYHLSVASLLSEDYTQYTASVTAGQIAFNRPVQVETCEYHSGFSDCQPPGGALAWSIYPEIQPIANLLLALELLCIGVLALVALAHLLEQLVNRQFALLARFSSVTLVACTLLGLLLLGIRLGVDVHLTTIIMGEYLYASTPASAYGSGHPLLLAGLFLGLLSILPRGFAGRRNGEGWGAPE